MGGVKRRTEHHKGALFFAARRESARPAGLQRGAGSVARNRAMTSGGSGGTRRCRRAGRARRHRRSARRRGRRARAEEGRRRRRRFIRRALRSARRLQRGAADSTCASQVRRAASTGGRSPFANRRDQRASSLARRRARCHRSGGEPAGATGGRDSARPRSVRQPAGGACFAAASAAPPSAPAAGARNSGIGAVDRALAVALSPRTRPSSPGQGSARARAVAGYCVSEGVFAAWVPAWPPWAWLGGSPHRSRSAIAPGTATAPRPPDEGRPGPAARPRWLPAPP
jgi:hypothetical protein